MYSFLWHITSSYIRLRDFLKANIASTVSIQPASKTNYLKKSKCYAVLSGTIHYDIKLLERDINK